MSAPEITLTVDLFPSRLVPPFGVIGLHDDCQIVDRNGAVIVRDLGRYGKLSRLIAATIVDRLNGAYGPFDPKHITLNLSITEPKT